MKVGNALAFVARASRRAVSRVVSTFRAGRRHDCRRGTPGGARHILPVGLLCLTLGAQSTFKHDVTLVRLLVSVKNQAGEVVGSLAKDEFEVFDCDVKQEVAVFDRQTAQPLSVSVLIDASGSTLKDVRYETGSIAKFFKALVKEGNPKDTAALYSFNYEVKLLHD